VKFINALRETGIAVQRATAAFSVNGRQYPAGSFVVKTAQAFRPHVIDMFEPQTHPDVFPYPGSPPTPPYDNAGWTLAFQMGVQFDRMLEPFTGPFENVTDGNVKVPAGRVVAAAGATGFVLSPRANDGFVALNRLLKVREDVRRVTDSMTVNGLRIPPGAFYIRNGRNTTATVATLATDLGLDFHAVADPAPASRPLSAARVGLWDCYDGSMPSGGGRAGASGSSSFHSRACSRRSSTPAISTRSMTCWCSWRARFPESAGDVAAVAVVAASRSHPTCRPSTADRHAGRVPRTGRPHHAGCHDPEAAGVHHERRYRDGDRHVGVESRGVESRGVESRGGARAAGRECAGGEWRGPSPHEVLRAGLRAVGTRGYAESPGCGPAENTDVFFDDRPVFKLGAGAAAHGVKPIAWYETKNPLRSGWAWGAQYLEGGLAAVEVPLGKGRVLLYGPEILQRAQPHGSFKFLFNGLVKPGITP
jgi:hypothetical protein